MFTYHDILQVYFVFELLCSIFSLVLDIEMVFKESFSFSDALTNAVCYQSSIVHGAMDDSPDSTRKGRLLYPVLPDRIYIDLQERERNPFLCEKERTRDILRRLQRLRRKSVHDETVPGTGNIKTGLQSMDGVQNTVSGRSFHRLVPHKIYGATGTFYI